MGAFFTGIKRRVLGVISSGIIFVGCSNCDRIPIEPFDSQGIISETYVNSFFKAEQPDSVKFYIESSGSMNGLFRRNLGTSFKYDVSSLVLHPELMNRIKSVALFGRNTEIINEYDPKTFRKKMNNGEFVSQASTVVPKMLEKIIEDINNSVCDVAVFISDMKYSPIGKDSKVNISQYSIDVKEQFAHLRNKSVSIISSETNYLAADGKEITKSFPYYYVVIGVPEKVVWMRNLLDNTLSEPNDFFPEKTISYKDFGIKYGCPSYSALPDLAIGMIRNNEEYGKDFLNQNLCFSFNDFDSSMQPAEVVLAINYSYLPSEGINFFSSSDFEVNSFWGTSNASLEVLPEDYSTNINKSYIEQVSPNIYVKLKISSLDENYKYDVINVLLKRKNINCNPMEKYYGAKLESELEKTLSIDGFINGLKSIYGETNSFQTEPIVIHITK